MLNNFSKREKILSYIFGVVLLFIILYYFGYNLVWKSIADTKLQLNNEILILAELEKKYDCSNNIKEELIDAENKLYDLKKRSGIDITDGSIWYMVGEYFEKSKLKVVSVKPQSLEEKGCYFNLPVQMSIKGKYNDIIDFFNFIENLTNIWSINNFRLFSGKDNNEINAVMKINVYGRKSNVKKLNLSRIISIQKEVFINMQNIGESSEIKEDFNKKYDKITEEKKGNYSFPKKKVGEQCEN
jgi:Tfp pilus assembly protein PilO